MVVKTVEGEEDIWGKIEGAGPHSKLTLIRISLCFAEVAPTAHGTVQLTCTLRVPVPVSQMHRR